MCLNIETKKHDCRHENFTAFSLDSILSACIVDYKTTSSSLTILVARPSTKASIQHQMVGASDTRFGEKSNRKHIQLH